MTFKKWLIVVVLQFFGIVWAILVFSAPLPRQNAGLIAGSMFAFVALLPLFFLWSQERRHLWVCWWSSLLFLLLIVTPMIGLRLMYWGTPFDEIVIGGLPARHLHSWAESFYLGMMIATWWDGVRFFLLPKWKVGSFKSSR